MNIKFNVFRVFGLFASKKFKEASPDTSDDGNSGMIERASQDPTFEDFIAFFLMCYLLIFVFLVVLHIFRRKDDEALDIKGNLALSFWLTAILALVGVLIYIFRLIFSA